MQEARMQEARMQLSCTSPSSSDHPQPADHTADAATVAALSVDGPPLRLIVFARAFRAIWVLKRWAFRAAERRASSRRHARRPPGAAERLRQRLRLYGMQMLRIAGDGNCQFRSISRSLYGTEEHHAFVRRAAVEHLRSHEEDFSGET